MTERERLVEMIIASVDGCAEYWAARIADYLLDNGVVLPPCRCKDCACAEMLEKDVYKCTHPQWNCTIYGMYKDDFCSYGERRENHEARN